MVAASVSNSEQGDIAAAEDARSVGGKARAPPIPIAAEAGEASPDVDQFVQKHVRRQKELEGKLSHRDMNVEKRWRCSLRRS